MGNSNAVYEIVTDQILKALEGGHIPWERPFIGHCNGVSKHQYRGINILLLSLSDAKTPYWITYNQAVELGGHVRKGAKSSVVTFWKMLSLKDKASETVEEKHIPFLRYFRVFNVEQCENLTIKLPETVTGAKIEACEAVLAAMQNKPTISEYAGGAHYKPSDDTVNVPAMAHFTSPEEYYAVLFHELIHATGHKSRLDRDCLNRFGSEGYAKEELIAEIGAAFLCARCGIQRKIDNRAAYIQNWLGALKNDTKLVIGAAGAAQKAVDYVLSEGVTNE